MKDMNAIKSNRDKLFDSIGNFLSDFGIFEYIHKLIMNLSERVLSVSAIVILHCIFVPTLLAFLNSLSDKLPSLDSVLLVTIALTIMTLHAIVKNDRLLIITHMIGFITNLVILSMVVFR